MQEFEQWRASQHEGGQFESFVAKCEQEGADARRKDSSMTTASGVTEAPDSSEAVIISPNYAEP